jgi:hypothetical protein
MNYGGFLFGVILSIVGAIGVGNALLSRYFSATPPLTWGRKESYRPTQRERLIMFAVSVVILAYGIWLIVAAWPR